MENTRITITPLYLSYTHGHPHPHKQQLSVLLKFKRILHSTGYELEKFQCKKTFPFPHSSAVNVPSPTVLDLRHYASQTAINFQLVREMELTNTRVDVIVIGLLNLGKDVNLLGIASLDLGLFQGATGDLKKEVNVRLDKCQDPSAYVRLEVNLKVIETPKRTEKSRRIGGGQPMGLLETEGFARDEVMLNRRKNPDMPTAYEISHRNYKQVQIVRTQEFTISPQTRANQKIQRSYKKRFEYQYEVSSSRIAKPKQEKGKQKGNKTLMSTQRNSPSPRLKTPQPIKETSITKKHQQGSSKQKDWGYLNMAAKNKGDRNKNDSISKSQVTERPGPKGQQRFQYSENQQHNREDQSNQEYPESSPSNQSSRGESSYRHQRKKQESTPNIQSFKDNKFKMITEKLERIEKRIMEKTPNYQEKSQPDIQSFDHLDVQESFQHPTKNKTKSEDYSQEDDQQAPRQPIEPLPYRVPEQNSKIYQSEVAHFSPKGSSKFEKQAGPQPQSKKPGFTIYQSEPVQIISPQKPKKEQLASQNIGSDPLKQSNSKVTQKENKIDKQQEDPLIKKSPIRRDFSNQTDSIKKYSQKQQRPSSKKSDQKKSDYVVDNVQQFDLTDQQSKDKQQKKNVSKSMKEVRSPQKQNNDNVMRPELTNFKKNEKNEKRELYNKDNISKVQKIPVVQKQEGNKEDHQVSQNISNSHIQCEEKILALQNQLEEQQENYRKLVMEKDLEHKQKIKMQQERLGDDLKELQRLRDQVLKQKKLIDKLNQMYEESDDKNFQISKDHEKKCMEYDRKLDGLNKKNQSLNSQLEEKDSQIEKLQKKVQKLTGDLKEVKEKMAAMVKAQNERVLQEKEVEDNSEGRDSGKSQKQLRKSEKQSIKSENSQAVEDNFKEGYINIKKKCVNLEAELKYRENQIRFLQIKNDNLVQEKRELENEIDMIASNNHTEMARKGSISKMNLESHSVTNSFKLENKALKEEISNLQNQVHELNQILEGLIRMDQSAMRNLMKKEPERKRHQEELNDIALYKKYKAVEQKAEAYGQQVRQKQETIAKIINLVWDYGNRSLMEQVTKLVSQ